MLFLLKSGDVFCNLRWRGHSRPCSQCEVLCPTGSCMARQRCAGPALVIACSALLSLLLLCSAPRFLLAPDGEEQLPSACSPPQKGAGRDFSNGGKGKPDIAFSITCSLLLDFTQDLLGSSPVSSFLVLSGWFEVLFLIKFKLN